MEKGVDWKKKPAYSRTGGAELNNDLNIPGRWLI